MKLGCDGMKNDELKKRQWSEARVAPKKKKNSGTIHKNVEDIKYKERYEQTANARTQREKKMIRAQGKTAEMK